MMPISSDQLDLLLQKGTRSRGANGHDKGTPMSDHVGPIYFSTPPNNARIARSSQKTPQPKLGFLETCLERGKKERFPIDDIIINPSRADALLKLNTHNRALKPTVVAQYAHVMRLGEWRNTTEAIVIDKNGVLVNGQHRLHAVIQADVSVTLTLWFGVEPDEFKIIDQGSKRGSADLVHINGHSNSSVRAPAAKILLILEAEDGHYRPAPQFVSDKVDEIGKKFERAVFWGEKLKRGPVKKITTGTAAAVAYYVMQEAGAPYERLEKFFEFLFRGADDVELMPEEISILREQLGKGVLSKGQDVAANVKRAAAIIKTWNYYIKASRVTRKGLKFSGKRRKALDWRWNSASFLPPVEK
jgi:hypothetical protein